MKRIALFAAALAVLGGYILTQSAGHRQATAAVAPVQGASVAGAVPQSNAPPGEAPVLDHPGFYAGEAGLNPSARAGREIWYKATAGNDRFHTYTFQQRIGVLIDWYRVLNCAGARRPVPRLGHHQRSRLLRSRHAGLPGARARRRRTASTGAPVTSSCSSSSVREGYRDPACDFKTRPSTPTIRTTSQQIRRQSACDLAFGTSTGALGIPQVSESAVRPRALAGSQRQPRATGTASASGFRANPKISDSARQPSRRRLDRAAVSHRDLLRLVSYRLRSTQSAEGSRASRVANIKGAIGNQYSRAFLKFSPPGMPDGSLEFQVFAHARPGTSDTSAVPTDQVNNPGTINAIINTASGRASPTRSINKWRKVTACGKERARIELLV